MRAKRWTTMTVAAAALLLAGCSGTSGLDATGSAGEAEIGAPAVAIAGDSGEAVGAVGAPADRATTTQPQQIVRTASVSIRVQDVLDAVREVRTLTLARSGVVTMEDTRAQDDATYSTITVQVPAAGLDAYLAELGRRGTVDAVSVTASDVTSQVVDLDARIRALRTSTARMTQLLAQATRVEDLLAIETQLSQRQAELDALVAQRDWLAQQVAMSTVTVSLAPAATGPVQTPGFVGGLERGWTAFTSAVAITVTAVGFVLPFAVIALLIATPIVVLALRQGRRRRPTQVGTDADRGTDPDRGTGDDQP